jgi:hypothetical protein
MQYIRVSDVVNELSVARQDDSRNEFLRLMILSKSVLRDLKVKFLNDFKRVYLPINPKTMTVRMPLDLMRWRTVSVIEKCKDMWGRDTEKVIPLTRNPYINITPAPTKASCEVCGCDATHPVCAELSNYTTLCEDVVIDPNQDPPLTGTRQTVLRTCPNGDIIKEVTQPTQKFIQGAQQCDYDITMEVIRQTVCDYTLSIQLTFLSTTVKNIRLIRNGLYVDSGVLTSYTQANTFFHSIGWIVDSNGNYHLNDSDDVYDLTCTVQKSDLTYQYFTLGRNCKEGNILEIPYLITSYVKNGVTITESPGIDIDTQADQDTFFSGLGFTKVDDTHYKIEDSTDVYYTMTVEMEESPPASPPDDFTLNFTQSNCERPMISDGISNTVTTDVLCNVEIKGCGCIPQTTENVDKIVSCCAPFLNCCQDGQLNNWEGWGYIPSCCPTNSAMPFNLRGTFNIDSDNLIIYLDNVNATKILLSYDDDGTCEGDMAFPDYCLDAFKAGLAYLHAQYNEEISMQRRRELKMNYEEEQTKLAKIYIDPIRMSDLIGALKTKLTPY